MTVKESHNTVEKSSLQKARPWIITLFLLLVVIAGLRLCLKNDWVLEQIKSTLITKVNEQIPGQLSAGKISGDLLKGLSLSNIALTDTSGTRVLGIDSLQVVYTLRGLLQPVRTLDQLRIYGIESILRQHSDSTWNIQTALAMAETDTSEATDEQAVNSERTGSDEEGDSIFKWRVNTLSIDRGRLDTESVQIPGERLVVDEISTRIDNVGFDGEWFGEMNQLMLSIRESPLDQPVDISLSGSVVDDRVTLGRLAINSGRSLIESRAELERMERLEGELTAVPLSAEDLMSYSGFPAEQDMELTIGFRGTLPSLYLTLEASATGLSNLRIETTFNFEEPYSLEYATIDIREFNGPLFTGLSTYPTIQSFHMEAGGELAWSQMSEASMSGSFSTGDIQYDVYDISQSDGHFNWNGSSADLSATVNRNGEELVFDGSIQALQSETPGWQLIAEGSDIDLAGWLSNPELESSLTITATAAGSGFEMEESPIDIELALSESRFGDMTRGNLTLTGRLTESTFNGEFQGGIQQSQWSGNVMLSGLNSSPTYQFNAETEGLNLAAFDPMSAFPTYLNIEIEGEGSGFSLEEMSLTSTVRIDSSVVNNEMIEEFTASVDIQNQYITLSNASLQSTMADGSLSLRHHMSDIWNAENRLEIDLNVKTIASLAPLFDSPPFDAQGELTGTMLNASTEEGSVRQFSGTIDFEHLSYDTLYTAEQIAGTIDIFMEQTPRVVADLEITRPVYNDIAINTIRLETETFLRDSLASEMQFDGSLRLALIQDSDNNITQSGTYQYNDGEFSLHTTGMSITTPYRSLSLSDSFNLVWQNSVLRMEQLNLTSDDGTAHLQLEIPYLGADRQNVRLDTRELNLGTIQQSLLDNIYANAMLSGFLQVERNGDDIEAESELILTGIDINGSSMDSLKTDIKISEGRMELTGNAWNESAEFFSLNAQLPFEPINPLSLGDDFFEQPVSGTIDLQGVSGEYLSSFFTFPTTDEIDGEIRFHGEISGTAGQPVFRGNLNLAESTISNVDVDSVNVDINYSHENATVGFDGFIRSLNTEVARFDAQLPLYIDLRHFRVDLPAEDDEFTINLTTDAFNLSLLNSFLGSEIADDLQGTLDGRLQVTGQIGDPDPEGQLTLRNGRIRLIPADIVINETTADLRFNSDGITLESFSMRSGRGELRASGTIELNQLRPGIMNIGVTASQFRIANRPDLNAVVDINSSLGGTFLKPEITGSMEFRSGYIYLQNFGENSIEEVTLEDESEEYSVALYDSVTIDMDVNFDRQFFLRNRQYLDMEVELDGSVDLVKETGGTLQMFGTLEGAEGYARPLGREFTLENAQVTFYGPINNPDLNIRTRYRPPQADENISIWYVIEGTVDEPEFSFESQPYLELQDIISYTIFGQPFYSLDSWAQVVSSNGNNTTATDLTLELLLDRVETLATRRLGIDVVQIDNSRRGTGSTTSIKTGWYLNDRTFFAISNEISTTPETLFILEYMLKENLELVITQGDNSREGIDLRWSFDY